MLLAEYGSDSESENESGPSNPPPPPPKAAAAKPKRKAPVKITLGLPKSTDDGEDGDKGKGKAAVADAEAPPAKKTKLAGAGSSSLLGMLPAPKRKLPTTASKPSLAVNKSMAAKPPTPLGGPIVPADEDDDKPALMMPATLTRAAAKNKQPSPELDLFGLSDAAAKPRPALATATPKPTEISSAPAVADFVPPPPTATDPYPGYYQLPSGSWAAYEPGYYASFFATGTEAQDELRAERDARDEGRIGRGWADLDDGRADIVDIDVSSGIAAARKEEERKANIIKPRLPGDEFEYQAVGQTKGLATERHQLSSLLHSAYSQRDELEARIAQNKKNMRQAGQKYGF